ncbi:ClpXP protease specificity-enhancing factor SspB [Sorangium sp. So ce136]|uniref:ClpXP protease specificity-enhancing factor SspB n=1 Tax=Sorangium sp. So ce136 TaxID=3133284 RepID=UPI003F056C2B
MSDVQRPLPPKKDVALALLEREPSVFIHLDPRRPGVSVPKWFTGQPQLILQVGMNMAIPIPDLKVDDEGISCTLSFNRAPFWCRLPWNAIWALVSEDQRGMVWPEDIPADLAAQKQRSPMAPPQKPAKRPRPRLAAVPSDEERDAEATDEARARDRDRARRPELEPVEPGEGRGAGEEPPARDAGAPVRPLAPVPAPAPALASVPALAPVRSTEEGEDDDSGSSGDPEPKPRQGAGKPKRELPPYLRVIK